MKKIISLLILIITFSSFTTYAQKTGAVLTFKDGTRLKGLGKIKASGKVKFRKTKKEKAVKYDFEELEKVKIYESDGMYTYVYRNVKDQEFPKVLELIEEGKVTLYRTYREGYYHHGSMMNANGGFVGGGFGGTYSIKNYYVQREGEEDVTHLGSNQLFSKNFKKAASAYFSDCETLVEMIVNKEFKKRHIREIVEFYNYDCE